MKNIQKQFITIVYSALSISFSSAKNQEVKAEIIGNKENNPYTVVISHRGGEVSRSTFKKNTTTGFVSKLHFNFDGYPVNTIAVYTSKKGNSTSEKIVEKAVVQNQLIPQLFKIYLTHPAKISLISNKTAPRQTSASVSVIVPHFPTGAQEVLIKSFDTTKELMKKTITSNNSGTGKIKILLNKDTTIQVFNPKVQKTADKAGALLKQSRIRLDSADLESDVRLKIDDEGNATLVKA